MSSARSCTRLNIGCQEDCGSQAGTSSLANPGAAEASSIASATGTTSRFTFFPPSFYYPATVVLTTWPLMPLAIWAFHAWLYPEKQPRWLVTAMPIVLVVAYLAEILLFWNL